MRTLSVDVDVINLIIVQGEGGAAVARDDEWIATARLLRRAKANASQDTDHGTAGPVFLAGLPVRGGFYGGEPSLTDLDNGDLKADVDFRSVYGEVLHRVLGADPEQVLGGSFPALGMLRT